MKKLKIETFKEAEGQKIIKLPVKPMIFTSPMVFVNGVLYPGVVITKGKAKEMVRPNGFGITGMAKTMFTFITGRRRFRLFSIH